MFAQGQTPYLHANVVSSTTRAIPSLPCTYLILHTDSRHLHAIAIQGRTPQLFMTSSFKFKAPVVGPAYVSISAAGAMPGDARQEAYSQKGIPDAMYLG